MNFGQKLIFAALGSILTIVGMLFSPFQKSQFGEIECTKLRIVNEDGKNRVVLATRETGEGRLSVYDEDGDTAISLGVVESGGYVSVWQNGKSFARLAVLEDGGTVVVDGKDGKSGVILGIGKHGGIVNVQGQDDKSRVGLGVDKHGGLVSVLGGDDKSWVALSVDEHGGVVGVKNKEGKRKAFVP